MKCSNLTIKTLQQRQLRRSGVSIVNFEHMSYLLLLLISTSNYLLGMQSEVQNNRDDQ